MGQLQMRDQTKSLMPHPPTGGGRGAREAAALPESITMAAGDGDGPQSRGGGPAAVAGSAVPEGQSKETHELHNKGEAFFVSFDIETAGEQVGFIQISAEVFRLNLVRNKDTQGKYKGQVNSVRDTERIRQSRERHQVVSTSHEQEPPLPAAPIDC